MSSWKTHFLISIELCGLSQFTSCTKPLSDTAASACTRSLVGWVLYSFAKEMSFSWTDHVLDSDFARLLHSAARMQDWIFTLIVWNVSFCCKNNSPQNAYWCNCILGTSVLEWLSQLSDYIFIFLYYIFIYLLALFSAYMITWCVLCDSYTQHDFGVDLEGGLG